MLSIVGSGTPLCDGLSRRELLRIGGVGLGGVTLPQLLRQRAEASARADHTPSLGKARSIILLFNSGGIPHHESFDPKPEAPREVRGEFGVIDTRTPGLQLGELLPKTAQLTDKMAIVRSMVTGDNAHSSSGYQMLTGVPHTPLSRENAPPGAPNDAPSFNALVRALRPSRGGLPASVVLPRRLANNGGRDPWPGTDAGFLGRAHDPWFLECDPAEPDFTVPGGELRDGMNKLRLDHRLSLLEQFNRQADRIERDAASSSYDRYQQQAIELIAGGKARTAFDLSQETDSVRERYGRHTYGQSVLLARRLVEAGVSLVQVHWKSLDKDKPNSGGWDTHIKHSESVKGWLLPVMDHTFSALIEDLDQRGLLDETLVCWVAEFGHTPKFNARAGRDHWGRVFSIALAGGGIRGGMVHGASDRHAAEPAADPVRPRDYLATLLHCLGYRPDAIVHDVRGRPLPATRGEIVAPLLA
jgi:hypothetical protein